MTTEIPSNPAPTAGASTENVSANVETPSAAPETPNAAAIPASSAGGTPAGSPLPGSTPAVAATGTTPVVGADGKVSYVPNYKYKAALQEKELDPFYHPLVKDADSEKKVKELFTKVDAFDFVKTKKEQIEQQYASLAGDHEQVTQTVSRFNESVKNNDLSSAFRLAGISKEQIFKWTQQQLQLMEMPPEQRQQYEQYEAAQSQKYDLEQKVSSLEQKFQHQAVQARTMQLDVALSRPEVTRFAEAWDNNSEPGAFKNFVVEEATRVFYETQAQGKALDLSPEQAIQRVMERFGKFLNVGDTTTQSPQAIPQNMAQRAAPPVIPNVVGKAASPVKKVPKNLDDLKALSKSMSG